MKQVICEIIIAILIEQNGYSEAEARENVKDSEGSEIWVRIEKILNSRFGKMVEFTNHISKLEKGCAPSVSLMDTRIDIAKKAIEKTNN